MRRLARPGRAGATRSPKTTRASEELEALVDALHKGETGLLTLGPSLLRDEWVLDEEWEDEWDAVTELLDRVDVGCVEICYATRTVLDRLGVLSCLGPESGIILDETVPPGTVRIVPRAKKPGIPSDLWDSVANIVDAFSDHTIPSTVYHKDGTRTVRGKYRVIGEEPQKEAPKDKTPIYNYEAQVGPKKKR